MNIFSFIHILLIFKRPFLTNITKTTFHYLLHQKTLSKELPLNLKTLPFANPKNKLFVLSL